MRRLLIAAIVAAALPSAAWADRAVIVGIDVYKDPSLSFQLAGASHADSERMKALLVGSLGYREEDILVLRNEAATRAAILDGIGTWLGGAGPGERAFFYFVGHGHFTKDLSADEADGLDEALVPYDATVDRSGATVAVEGMVIDDELGAAFARLEGRQVTAVIDSCHSGTVTRSVSGGAPNGAARTPQFAALTRAIRVDPSVVEQKQSGAAPDPVPASVDLVTWTAVSPTQLALIDETKAPAFSGVFTTAFADGIEKGLADRNGNGVISNQELLDYVRERSAGYCKARPQRCEMGLTPSLDGTDAALKVAATLGPPSSAATPAGGLLNKGAVTAGKILDVLGATPSDTLVLEQIPPSPVKLGARDIRFRVTSPRDGFLVLLSVSDQGELVQLFPNALSDRHAKSGRIRAGATITVPDPSYGIRFDATSVTKGTVIALVANDPLHLSDRFVTRQIQVIPQDEVNSKVLPELAQSLATAANAEAAELNTKPVERAVTTLHYEIVP